MPSIWHDADDDIYKLNEQAETMNVDQRLELAELKALLAIGQELSGIRHGGVNPNYSTD